MSLKKSKSSGSLSKLPSKLPSKSPLKSPLKSPSPFSLTGVGLRDFMNPVIPDTVVMSRKKSPKSSPKKQSLVELKALKEVIRKIRLQINILKKQQQKKMKEEIQRRVTDRNFPKKTEEMLTRIIKNSYSKDLEYNKNLLFLENFLAQKLAKLQTFKFISK
jgi:hypothetical protein